MVATRSRKPFALERVPAASLGRLEKALLEIKVDALPAAQGARISAKYVGHLLPVWGYARSSPVIAWRPFGEVGTRFNVPETSPIHSSPDSERASGSTSNVGLYYS